MILRATEVSTRYCCGPEGCGWICVRRDDTHHEGSRYCSGKRCMAWRDSKLKAPGMVNTGYCGLAGRPFANEIRKKTDNNGYGD